MTRRRFSGSFLLGTPRQSRWIALAIIATTTVVLVLAIPQPVQAAVFACTAGDVQCLIASINQANGNSQTNTIQLANGTYTLTMPIGGPSGPIAADYQYADHLGRKCRNGDYSHVMRPRPTFAFCL